MGWTYIRGWTNEKVVQDRIKDHPRYPAIDVYKPGRVLLGYDQSCRTIAHHFTGAVLYTVREVTNHYPDGREESHRYIGVDLIEQGGYKDMEEAMGPYYFDCPLAFLDMAPEANAEWRQQVRKHHAA